MKLELKKIGQQREKWLKAVNSNDLEGLAEVLTDNAVWIPTGLPPLKGRKAISEWMNPFFETYNYEFNIDDMKIRGADDWAVEQASFTSKTRPKEGGGEESAHQGKYILIWKWEKDNQWRIEKYLDDSDPEKQ